MCTSFLKFCLLVTVHHHLYVRICFRSVLLEAIVFSVKKCVFFSIFFRHNYCFFKLFYTVLLLRLQGFWDHLIFPILLLPFISLLSSFFSRLRRDPWDPNRKCLRIIYWRVQVDTRLAVNLGQICCIAQKLSKSFKTFLDARSSRGDRCLRHCWFHYVELS